MSEEDLERAIEKIKRLKGPKRRLMIKAVVKYVDAMAGEVDERGT